MKKQVVLLVGLIALFPAVSYVKNGNRIPKTWDLDAIKKFHLPPPDSSVKVIYASEEYYNALPEHVISKTFPVFVREFERPGYLDSIRKLEPEIVFDASTLKTEADWVKAGELVFNWPVAYTPYDGKVARLSEKDFENGNGKLTRDGAYLFNRYVINEKGK